MAKAYICDRCGDSHHGSSEARVFLESHIIKQTGRGSAVLAAHADLCSACTTEIKKCVERRPQRGVADPTPGTGT